MLNLLVLLAIVGFTPSPRADQATQHETLLQRFAVNRAGDYLLVPVQIEGKKRLFAVDTGCSCTVLDKTLISGDPIKIATIGTTSGVGQIKLYGLSGATIGNIPLVVDQVAALDLKPIQELAGLQIEGLLGMDFLRRYGPPIGL